MAHREEILAAVLALWATDRLAHGRPVPWSELEQRLEVDLTGDSGIESSVRFGETEDRVSLPPSVWLESLDGRGAERLALLPKDSITGETPAMQLDGHPIEDRVLHAFAGTGGLLLVAITGNRLFPHRTRVWFPPATTLTATDILAFIESQPEPKALRESLLWEDEHNLHVTDGTDWERFVAALRPEHDETLVGTLDRCVSNARFEQGEAEAWWQLKKHHQNPQHAWQLHLLSLGSAQGAVPDANVEAQARRLDAALEAIQEFAKQIDQTHWTTWFRDARALLDDAPTPPWMDRYFTGCALTEPSWRLIAASVQADVFGGMGSWNDINPPDSERYDRLSTALFEQLTPSLVTAVNASTQAKP